MSQLHRPCSSTSAFCLIRSNPKSERARTCNEQQKNREQRQEKTRRRTGRDRPRQRRARLNSFLGIPCKYLFLITHPYPIHPSSLSSPPCPISSVGPLLHQILYHFRRHFL